METQLNIILEGKRKERGDVRLSEFVTALDTLKSALFHTHRHLGEPGRPTLYIEDLSHSSPATAVIGDREAHPELFETLFDALENMGDGKAVTRVGYETLDDLSELAQRVTKGKVGGIRIAGNGREGATFNADFLKRLEAELAPELTCFSTVEGWLERLNLHNNANQFVIYPPSIRKGIRCYVSQELVKDAIAAVDKKVAVSGQVSYRPRAEVPYEVNVERIEVFNQDEVPRFEKLRGLVPEITDGLTTEEYLERIHDEWE